MQNDAKEVPEYMFLPGIEHWEPVIQDWYKWLSCSLLLLFFYQKIKWSTGQLNFNIIVVLMSDQLPQFQHI